MKQKGYCTCKTPNFHCTNNYGVGPAFDGEEVWIHSTCQLPFREVWEKYIRRCISCLKETSLPFEDMCQKCFQLEVEFDPSLQRPWGGWTWAAAMMRRAWQRPGEANVEGMEKV
jgi:hypothetical protein